MPAGLKDLRQRVGTVREIRRVTLTLQRVAAARLVGDRRELATLAPYAERLKELAGDVAARIRIDGEGTPGKAPETGSVGVVVFGSEQGLCGSFNHDLADTLGEVARQNAEAGIEVLAVGRVARRLLGRRDYRLVFGEDRTARDRRGEQVDALAARIVADFQGGRYGRVLLLYMGLITAMRHEPILTPLLPVPAPEEAGKSAANAIFEPGPRAILAALLDEYVRRQLDQAFVNTAASENAARQLVMGMAAENAENILGDLTRRYRRLRQELITTELLELLGGEATEAVGALTG